MTTNASRAGAPAIPSAGADMRHLLDQEVVIDGVPTVAPTGALAIANVSDSLMRHTRAMNPFAAMNR